MEPKCPVCQHKDVSEINRDIVLRSMSVRNVGSKYSIPFNYIQKHKPHITKNLALAAERRDMNAADRLLEDTEMLWRETQNALALSKEAVKTMAITEGHGKQAKTIHKEYRDVGALLGAIKVAHENRRLFGDATGALKPNSSTTQVGIYLSIVMPRMDDTPPSIEAPIIEVPVLSTDEDDPELLTGEGPSYPDFDGEPYQPPTILGEEAQERKRSLSPTPRAEPPTEPKVYPPWEPRKAGRPFAGGRKRDPSEYKKDNAKLKASVKEKIWGPRPPKD